ncbi:MAG: MFS transporter [Planctomycetota bacterium]|jgi:nucleoside transporter
MGWQLYIGLSVMMFLEFAIWGAWAPVLAARLLGPLKFSGKQTGWIYATIALASIVSPLIAGQITDQWVATQWFLGGAHLIGGVLFFVAAKKGKFGSLFAVMCMYAICYAATLPLVNSLMFTQLGKVFESKDAVNTASANIFIWAPIAWVLVGLILTGWRRIKGTGDGSDCLKFAGILSFIMGVYCFFLPHTPPAGAGGDVLPFVEAVSMLKEGNFLLFLILSFIVAGQLQFYFLGTAQYLGDIGVQSKNVPAVMAIAQAMQVLATFFALGWMLKNAGFQWTLAVGSASWLLMYVIYSVEKPKVLVISSMAFHGIAYVFFIIGGQIYVNSVAPESIKGSAQALVFFVTMGLGLFFGTQFAGIVMDKFRIDGKFQWRKIYLVPCVLLVLCVLGFVLFFKG